MLLKSSRQPDGCSLSWPVQLNSVNENLHLKFATILAGISAGGMYCPECGMVHWSDGVTPPF
ncbi:hypothetical protein AC067_26145 [Escherichia coli]|nr:hypothetical protein AC067_26145 [Escherichia coli]